MSRREEKRRERVVSECLDKREVSRLSGVWLSFDPYTGKNGVVVGCSQSMFAPRIGMRRCSFGTVKLSAKGAGTGEIGVNKKKGLLRLPLHATAFTQPSQFHF